ncbi:hypothetical protein M408DRAFT_319784, partial [Serendipita vermifera MAFF 305830]
YFTGQDLEILASFEQLQNLEYIRLKHYLDTPYAFTHHDANIFVRFPSVTDASRVAFSAQLLKMSSFANLKSVVIRNFGPEMVDALTGIHDLRALTILYRLPDPRSGVLKHKQIEPCLPTVKEFYYSDANYDSGRENMPPSFDYAVQCLGQNLTKIIVEVVNIRAVPSMLASFERFQRLRDVNIQINISLSSATKEEMETSVILIGIKTLLMIFRRPEPESNLNGYDSEQIRTARQEPFAHLFEALVFLVPYVEDLTLGGWFSAEMAVKYVKQLHHLRAFNITTAALEDALGMTGSYYEGLAMDYMLTTDFLDSIHSQSLHLLRITNAFPGLYASAFVTRNPENIKIAMSRCLTMFRFCEEPAFAHRIHVTNIHDRLERYNVRLSWEYELPLDRLNPSPALPSNVHQWLVGKRERRWRFREQSLNNPFLRYLHCPTQDLSGKPQWVTGHSLDVMRLPKSISLSLSGLLLGTGAMNTRYLLTLFPQSSGLNHEETLSNYTKHQSKRVFNFGQQLCNKRGAGKKRVREERKGDGAGGEEQIAMMHQSSRK